MKVWIERVARNKRSKVKIYAASNKGERKHLIAQAFVEDLSQGIQDAIGYIV